MSRNESVLRHFPVLWRVLASYRREHEKRRVRSRLQGVISVVTSLSLGVGLYVSLARLGALLFKCNEKSVSSFKSHLVEVGLWYYESDFVSVVDHLNF